jgi:hypothetical protein
VIRRLRFRWRRFWVGGICCRQEGCPERCTGFGVFCRKHTNLILNNRVRLEPVGRRDKLRIVVIGPAGSGSHREE